MEPSYLQAHQASAEDSDTEEQRVLSLTYNAPATPIKKVCAQCFLWALAWGTWDAENTAASLLWVAQSSCGGVPSTKRDECHKKQWECSALGEGQVVDRYQRDSRGS